MGIPVSELRGFVRRWRANPGLTLIPVATLALGLAGGTLVFSVVEALLLRSLPYADPPRMVVVTPNLPTPMWDVYEQMRDRARSLSAVTAYIEVAANASVAGRAERILVARIDGPFLEVHGVQPTVGRGLSTFKSGSEQGDAALITHAAWQRWYGRSMDVVGRTLVLDGHPHTIVGVLPLDFQTLSALQPAAEGVLERRVSVVAPLGEHPAGLRTGSDRVGRGFSIVGRLRDGRDLDEARAEFAAIAKAVRTPSSWSEEVVLRRLDETLAGNLSSQLALLSAAVAMLFFVACGNTSTLLLERVEARRREMALRLALGARLQELTIAVVTEALLVALAAGLVGSILAYVGLHVIRTVTAPVLSRMDTVTINLNVLAFSLVLAISATALVSLSPVARLLKIEYWNISRPPQRERRWDTEARMASIVVVAQVAMSTALVVLAGLVSVDFVRLLGGDPGVRTRGILTAEVALETNYDREGARRYFADLVSRAAALPGVDTAALVAALPGGPFIGGARIAVDGGSPQFTHVGEVSSDYFRVLGIRLMAGRVFNDQDTGKSLPVVVVNEIFARAHWQEPAGALNKVVRFGRAYTVIGVVRDTGSLTAPSAPKIYLNFLQMARPSTQMTLLLSARDGDASSVSSTLTEMGRTLDRPLFNVVPLERVVTAKFARQRLLAVMMSAFACVAVLLAAGGVYASVSSALTERIHEMGVRMAVGGTRTQVLALIARRGMRLVTMGIALGVPMAIVARWVMSSEIVGTGAISPGVCVGAMLTTTVVGLLASVLAAARGTRVDPLVALRTG